MTPVSGADLRIGPSHKPRPCLIPPVQVFPSRRRQVASSEEVPSSWTPRWAEGVGDAACMGNGREICRWADLGPALALLGAAVGPRQHHVFLSFCFPCCVRGAPPRKPKSTGRAHMSKAQASHMGTPQPSHLCILGPSSFLAWHLEELGKCLTSE